MGCASSKQKVCRKCKAPCSPVRRSFSTRHRRSKESGDTNHIVFLNSSTLGSLSLVPLIQTHDLEILQRIDKLEPPINQNLEDNPLVENEEIVGSKTTTTNEFETSMIEAKTWSEMIDKKIPKIVPKTPVRTPPGEPETIDVRELMEGLDDMSPLRQVYHFRSLSLNVHSPAILPQINDPRIKEHGENESSSKPLSSSDIADSDSNSNDTSIISEFDPDVIASFRKALEELPSANPFHLNPVDAETESPPTDEKDENISTNKIAPRSKNRVVVYFTSLRGVRKTFEDCCHVRVIFKGLRVKVDERDVSMHAGFKDELKELLGERFGTLPRVFIGTKYIGGSDEIRRLNEEGKLQKTVENCELLDDLGSVCESCGDIRFVPCGTCSGSCKIYYQEEYDDDDEEEGYEIEHDYGFQRCPDCNENGLIRCPICCAD